MSAVIGELPGLSEGDWFADRTALRQAGIHLPLVHGIAGNKQTGAYSVVLSGGYEDDTDYGHQILYTGAGGQKDKKQVADQDLANAGNAALVESSNRGLPVRLTRGHKHRSPWSPSSGYEYGGLFLITDYWEETGAHGFKICRFRLEKLISSEPTGGDSSNASEEAKSGQALRRSITSNPIVRDTDIIKAIKGIYANKCQVCGTTVETQKGNYSEGAHIRGLGYPHNGPDSLENLLCLCPNHHKGFDRGGWSVQDDLTLIGAGVIVGSKLYVDPTHKVDLAHFQYHRRCFGFE